MKRLPVVGFGLALLATPPVAAQSPLSSARSIGMAGSFTAAARGYEAIRWNPALLGMPGRPGFSVNLLQAGFDFGSNTFNINDVRTWGGEFLTDADKQTILGMVQENGPDVPLRIESAFDVQGLAMTVGNFGLAVRGFGTGTSTLSQDAVELLLFGNATRTAPGEIYDGSGTTASGWAAGTVEASFGAGIPVPVGALAVGITGRYLAGLGIGYAEDINTSLQNSPTFDLRAGGHALVMDVDQFSLGGSGSGFGVDLGGAYELASGLRFGLVLENIINTMAWSDDNLEYYNEQFQLTEVGDDLIDQTLVDIEGVPFDPNDPQTGAQQAALRDSLSTLGNLPSLIRAGVALESGILTVAGDIMYRFNNGIDFGDTQRISAGAEVRLISILALRAGLASNLEDTFTFAGGAGLKLGPVRLDTGLSSTPSGDRKGVQVAVGVGILP